MDSTESVLKRIFADREKASLMNTSPPGQKGIIGITSITKNPALSNLKTLVQKKTVKIAGTNTQTPSKLIGAGTDRSTAEKRVIIKPERKSSNIKDAPLLLTKDGPRRATATDKDKTIMDTTDIKLATRQSRAFVMSSQTNMDQAENSRDTLLGDDQRTLSRGVSRDRPGMQNFFMPSADQSRRKIPLGRDYHMNIINTNELLEERDALIASNEMYKQELEELKVRINHIVDEMTRQNENKVSDESINDISVDIYSSK